MTAREEATELVASVRIVVEVEPSDDGPRSASDKLEHVLAAAIHRGLIEADVDQRLETELRRHGLELEDLDAVVLAADAPRATQNRREGPY